MKSILIKVDDKIKDKLFYRRHAQKFQNSLCSTFLFFQLLQQIANVSLSSELIKSMIFGFAACNLKCFLFFKFFFLSFCYVENPLLVL